MSTLRCTVLCALLACGGSGSPSAHDAGPPQLDAAHAIDAARPLDAPVSAIGCSDGDREGLTPAASFPDIAACAAQWAGELDLRAPRTGVACGNELAACGAPADACSPGWHICATSGDVSELLVLSATQCATIPGRFVAASDHCLSDGSGCAYAAAGSSVCLAGSDVDCTQPICCGSGCQVGGCLDGVWPGGTTENGGTTANGCGNTLSSSQDGVLCCKG